MKIGIISDTHDNLPKIKEAVKILNDRKVEFVFHCGDFISPFSLEPLSGLNCDWVGVFGNNDGDKQVLTQKGAGKIKYPPYFAEKAGKRIVITHSFIECDADIILYGHTHNPDIKLAHRDDGGRDKVMINPGEVGGWLTGKSTLVVMDLAIMKPEIVYF